MPATRLNIIRQRVETPEAADYLKNVDTTHEETEDGQSGEETEDDDSDEEDQRDLCLCAKLRPPVNEGQPYIAMNSSKSPLQVGYGTTYPVAMLLYSIEDRHGVKVSLLGIRHDEMSTTIRYLQGRYPAWLGRMKPTQFAFSFSTIPPAILQRSDNLVNIDPELWRFMNTGTRLEVKIICECSKSNAQ